MHPLVQMGKIQRRQRSSSSFICCVALVFLFVLSSTVASASSISPQLQELLSSALKLQKIHKQTRIGYLGCNPSTLFASLSLPSTTDSLSIHSISSPGLTCAEHSHSDLPPSDLLLPVDVLFVNLDDFPSPPQLEAMQMSPQEGGPLTAWAAALHSFSSAAQITQSIVLFSPSTYQPDTQQVDSSSSSESSAHNLLLFMPPSIETHIDGFLQRNSLWSPRWEAQRLPQSSSLFFVIERDLTLPSPAQHLFESLDALQYPSSQAQCDSKDRRFFFHEHWNHGLGSDWHGMSLSLTHALKHNMMYTTSPYFRRWIWANESVCPQKDMSCYFLRETTCDRGKLDMAFRLSMEDDTMIDSAAELALEDEQLHGFPFSTGETEEEEEEEVAVVGEDEDEESMMLTYSPEEQRRQNKRKEEKEKKLVQRYMKQAIMQRRGRGHFFASRDEGMYHLNRQTIPGQFASLVDPKTGLRTLNNTLMWRSYLLRWLLRPNALVRRDVAKRWIESGMRTPCVAAHIRHGDKAVEAQLFHVYDYVVNMEALCAAVDTFNVFLSTEDAEVVEVMKQEFGHIFETAVTPYRRANDNFIVGIRENKLDATQESLHSIANLFLAAQCDAFIGTYTSNWSRLVFEMIVALKHQVPPYASLDSEWILDP